MNRKFVSGDLPEELNKLKLLQTTTFDVDLLLLNLNKYILTSNFKELHEVVELTMDISTHSDRTVDSLLEKHKFIQCFVMPS